MIDDNGLIGIIISFIYFIPLLIIFFIRRKKYPISARNFTQLDLILILLIGMGSIAITVRSYVENVNCTGKFIAIYLIVSSFLIPYLLRAFRLWQLFNINLQLRDAEKEFLSNLSNFKKKGFSRFFIITLISFGTLLLLIIISIAVDFTKFQQNCQQTPSKLPQASAICFYIAISIVLISVIILIYYLRKVNDAFNIKNELIVIGICIIIFFGMQIAGLLDLYSFLIILIIILIFSISFTAPVILSYRKIQQKLTNTISINEFLGIPLYFTAFVKYSIKEFATEKPLFYNAHKNFLTTYKNTINDDEKSKLVVQLYNKYIKENSPLQLNLPQELVVSIENKLKKKEFSENIFDGIANHNLETMISDSWPRFLKSVEYKQLRDINV